ncbi:RRT6 (YGL146C) [Zygosaccharomyces parabailii]|nr:RRT6 (YGL146C) [Zygosaccharomyces parabailii]
MELWICGVLLLKLALQAFGAGENEIRDVSLQLDPIKASNYDPLLDNFCFRMELISNDVVSNALFIIDVVDILSYHTDSGRFGGTSKERGRQSLHMSIEDPITGDLIRSTRHLKSGKTFIEMNPRDSPQFDLCFVNLVYDSSWNSLDLSELITVSLNTKEQLAWAKLNYLQETYQTSQEIEQRTKKLSSVINGQLFIQLSKAEMEHRDYNESIYDSFLSAFIVFTVSVISSPIFLAYYCIRYRRRIRPLSPRH